MGQFTDTEIEIAKSVDLVNLAESVQIPLKVTFIMWTEWILQ